MNKTEIIHLKDASKTYTVETEMMLNEHQSINYSEVIKDSNSSQIAPNFTKKATKPSILKVC